jgi:hypothetical protein
MFTKLCSLAACQTKIGRIVKAAPRPASHRSTPLSEVVFEPILNLVEPTFDLAPHMVCNGGDVIYPVLDIIEDQNALFLHSVNTSSTIGGLHRL